MNPASYLKRGTRFKFLFPTLKTLVQRRSVTRSDLESIGTPGETIWYGPEEDPFEVDSPDGELLERFLKSYPTAFAPDRQFVCELDDCRLLDEHATFVSSDNRLILETLNWTVTEFVTLNRHRRSRNRFLKKTLWNTKTAAATETCRLFPLVCSDPSYYHWMLECLPKLRRLELYEQRTGNTPTVLIESDPRQFVLETLELAGLDLSRCLQIRELNNERVPKLLVPMQRPHLLDPIHPDQSPYSPSKSDVQWLRERVRATVDPDEFTGTRSSKVFVSRQQASRGRKVENYDAFEETLRERGFVPYVLENMAFREQVALFMNADVVLGAIGAGLTNMMFSDDLLVIEMFPKTVLTPERKFGPDFCFLSQITGLDYEPIVTAGTNDNLLIDIGSFNDRMDAIGV